MPLDISIKKSRPCSSIGTFSVKMDKGAILQGCQIPSGFSQHCGIHSGVVGSDGEHSACSLLAVLRSPCDVEGHRLPLLPRPAQLISKSRFSI